MPVGIENIAVDVLDAEWRETGRNAWIGEVTVGGYRDVHTIAVVRSGAEHVDGPRAEVRGKEKDTVNIGAKNETLVNRARRVIDGEDRLIRRGQTAGPSRNRAVLGIPDERCRHSRIGHE